VPERIWVGLLDLSPRTAHKIATLHGLQADEVREAVQCISGLSFSWEEDLTVVGGRSFGWPIRAFPTWSSCSRRRRTHLARAGISEVLIRLLGQNGERHDRFYEEDETIEKVRAAYEHGAKGVTGPLRP